MKNLFVLALNLSGISGYSQSNQSLLLTTYSSIEGSGRAINISQKANGQLRGTYNYNGHMSDVPFQNGQGSVYYSPNNNQKFSIRTTSRRCIEISWNSGSHELCLDY